MTRTERLRALLRGPQTPAEQEAYCAHLRRGGRSHLDQYVIELDGRAHEDTERDISFDRQGAWVFHANLYR